MTLYVDPATGARSGTPQTLPLTIKRNLRVVASRTRRRPCRRPRPSRSARSRPSGCSSATCSTAARSRTSPTRGPTPTRRPTRSTARASTRSTSRSRPVTVPTCSGRTRPRTAYAFRRSGSDIERDGLTLMPMSGRLTDAPATARVSRAARRVRASASEMTLAQLAPQLKAQGVDPAALREKLLPVLTAADRRRVAAMFTAPVPIKLPRLGRHPAAGRADDRRDRLARRRRPDDERRPRPVALAGLGTMLAKPEYADNEVVQGTLAALRSCHRTPARGHAAAVRADRRVGGDDRRLRPGQGRRHLLVKTLIPFGLTILGVVCLLGAPRSSPPARASARPSELRRARRRAPCARRDRPQRPADRHRRRQPEQRVDRA